MTSFFHLLERIFAFLKTFFFSHAMEGSRVFRITMFVSFILGFILPEGAFNITTEFFGYLGISSIIFFFLYYAHIITIGNKGRKSLAIGLFLNISTFLLIAPMCIVFLGLHDQFGYAVWCTIIGFLFAGFLYGDDGFIVTFKKHYPEYA